MMKRSIVILQILLASRLTSAEKGHLQEVVLPSRIEEPSPLVSSLVTERAQYVRAELLKRMEYVQGNRRIRDFSKWAKDGSMRIYSMLDEADLEEVEREKQIVTKTTVSRRGDPFPSDRLNLDLVETSESPSPCYGGTVASESRKIKNWELVLRAIRLTFSFAPCFSAVGLAVVSRRFREGVWYPWLTRCIASSGAAWIKWGQWSSTRSDMFPEALCENLSTLHADAPAHSWEFSKQSLALSLGVAADSVDSVFDNFEPSPIASGSIAQVHKATLGGRPIAVKIRHPNVARLIDLDFRLMTGVARLCDYIPALSWLHVRESVEQFSHTMAAQSYLNVEAHHLEALNYNFRRWPRIQFPKPFYASPSIIMESFEPGMVVTSVIEKYQQMGDYIQKGKDMGYLRSVQSASYEGNVTQANDVMPTEMKRFIVTNGLGLYLKMLLVDNLMHADLHPGNILLETNIDNNNVGFDGKIVLVDAGMVAQLTDRESSTFVGLLGSLGEGDGREAANFALQFSVQNNMSEKAQEAFRKDMDELFQERCRGYGTGVDVGHVLRGVLGLIRKHQVRIDANYATLVINILCLESLASQVCPDYDLLDAARPLLQSFRRLCYRADGTPIPKNERVRWLNGWLAMMNLKKNRDESEFFRRHVKDNNWELTKDIA